MSNKTHIVTAQHATKTKNSSCQLCNGFVPQNQTSGAPPKAGTSEGCSPPSGSPGGTGTQHGGSRCGASGWAEGFIVNPAMHINFIKEQSWLWAQEEQGFDQRNGVLIAVEQPVPALVKPGSLKKWWWHL